ncbi:MAG TPA: ABC transporter ATP-binding protein [Thermoanaerobaculia bacterium]|nr:ABC transporter ATP-binding protein [Thermoanaerobaculia bacterium]
MAEPLFQIRDLTKRYGDRTVLDHLSFDVERGECLVVLGRSGSGKSVTLRQLNGLEWPDEGSVVFDGVDVCQLSEHQLYPLRQRIAMLFQSGALFDSMTVLDNVAFPLREHAADLGDEEIQTRVREKLALVQLEEVEEKMPSDLSGGMKKRVALARSLMSDPEVVLFDEPTTGLDPVTSATIARLIRSVRDMGVTSVVVTHDLPLARSVADRLAFLFEGRFRFLGTWAEAEASDDQRLADFLAGREDTGAIDAA